HGAVAGACTAHATVGVLAEMGAAGLLRGRGLLAAGGPATGARPRPGRRRRGLGCPAAAGLPADHALVVLAGLACLPRGDRDLLADGGQAGLSTARRGSPAPQPPQRSRMATTPIPPAVQMLTRQ